MSGNRLYGPFFFEDAQTGNACTITTETYIEMLETVMNVDITPDIWFQQDGATAHTSVIARDWLKFAVIAAKVSWSIIARASRTAIFRSLILLGLVLNTFSFK